MARACNALDKMSRLLAFVEGLNRTVGGRRACVVGLINAEMVRVWSVITAALLESKGTFREAMCDVHDRFPVEASFDVLGPCVGGSCDQA